MKDTAPKPSESKNGTYKGWSLKIPSIEKYAESALDEIMTEIEKRKKELKELRE